MPKYRLLTFDELKAMEKEFVAYLVVNGITADDWEKIKKEDPKKAQNITDLFSDVVFERVMRNVKYLMKTTQKELFSFECLDDQIKLIGLNAKEVDGADLTDNDYVKAAIANPPIGFKIFQSEKKYNETRETELFQMISNGAFVTDEKLHNSLLIAIEP